jgi:hypothetical protein
MHEQGLRASERASVQPLTSNGWRRPRLRRRGGRKRRLRRASLALALLACSGCSYADFLEDFPVSEGVFWVSGGLVGVSATVGLAPVTVPLAAVTSDDERSLELLLYPGLGLGAAAGAMVSLPFLMTEALLTAPFKVLRRRSDAHADCGQPQDAWYDAVSICPYCGAEDGACDWGGTCDQPQVDAELDAALEQAWPPTWDGPPEEPEAE